MSSAPTLTPVEWIIICGAAGLAITIIGHFIRRNMARTDEHDKDINHIKQTYVTKDELKELKTELRDETKKLTADVSEIKENYIRKDDFYRSISDVRRDVEKVYDFLIKTNGGRDNGPE